MSDLLDPLRGLAQEPTRPLPPSEVRRRGDRQRRRRTAAAMAGAACTVAVVAFGAVTIAQNASTDSSRELPPATQPPTPTPAAPATPVTRIPAGFPVDEGMAQAEEVEGPSRTALFLADASICGAMSYATDHEPVDAVGVSHHGLEYSRSRELQRPSRRPDRTAGGGRAGRHVPGLPPLRRRHRGHRDRRGAQRRVGPRARGRGMGGQERLPVRRRAHDRAGRLGGRAGGHRGSGLEVQQRRSRHDRCREPSRSRPPPSWPRSAGPSTRCASSPTPAADRSAWALPQAGEPRSSRLFQPSCGITSHGAFAVGP